MKLDGKQIEITRSSDMTEKDFGMRLEDAPHIFGILRDKLYSDKIQAPIREYSTNATDAHVEAGIADTPIVVTLPTAFEPNFKVRDFGEGLSRDGIFEVYVSYGRSTKRATNNAIGQLGLGSKSAFTYGENFTITSFHDGTKAIYNAYIDETGLGKVALMHEEDSDEPTGVEISIPVRREDIRAFHDRARTLYSYFRVPPVVKGVADFELWRPEYAFKGDGWAVFAGDRRYRNLNNARSVAVMGDIGYPLNAGAIPDLPADLSALLQADLRLDFDIGELSISASREALEYTEHTVKHIKKKLRAIQKSVVDELSKDLQGAKTKFEALKKIGDVMGQNTAFGRQVQNIIGNTPLQWNGEPISSFTLSQHIITKNNKCRIATVETDTWKKRIYDHNWYSINYNSHLNITIQDATTRWTIRAKKLLTELREKDPSAQLLVIQDIADGEEAWVLENMHITKDELISLAAVDVSDIKEEEEEDVDTPKEKVKNKKHSLQCFRLDWDQIRASCGQTRSKCWEPIELDLENDEGIYVELDHFYVKLNEARENADCLFKFARHLELSGIDPKQRPIYGVKTKSIPKVGEHFVRLEDYAADTVKEFLEAHNVRQKIIDYEETAGHRDIDVDRVIGLEDKFVDASSPVFEYAEAVREMRQHRRLYDRYSQLYQFYKTLGLFGEDMQPSNDLNQMRRNVFARYPLLRTLRMFDSTNHKDVIMKKMDMDGVLDYINSIDSKENEDNG